MSRKTAADVQPAGIFGPIVLGLILASCGMFFGVFHLMAKDPSVVDANRRSSSSSSGGEEDAPSMPGFLDRKPVEVVARKGPSGGRNWQTLEKQVAAGRGSVTISAGELNEWARRSFRISSPEEGGGFFTLVPEAPNFWMEPEQLHVNMGLEFTLFGNSLETRYIARGPLRVTAGGLRFSPEELYLGCAKIPTFGGVAGMLDSLLLAIFGSSETAQNVRDSLARVDTVVLSEGSLQLTF